jgi:hypothetical protein
MNEDNGSAEEQARRLEERGAESRTQRRRGRGEGYGMTEGWESNVGSIRRFGRRVLANPAGPLAVGLALIVGSAAVIAVQKQRSRPLNFLRIRSREAAEALRDGDLAVRPRVVGVIARLAALGLAGLTWRRMRSLARGRIV